MIIIQPSIDPILISLGFLDIRWYSLAYIFTFIFGSILIKKFNKQSYSLVSNTQIDKFFIWAVIGVIIGGRSGWADHEVDGPRENLNSLLDLIVDHVKPAELDKTKPFAMLSTLLYADSFLGRSLVGKSRIF